MDLRKLEALAVAVELGSFTKAAQQLGYSQSGLTHMMNALEQEIGFSSSCATTAASG
ncbi:MAG: LysR family transcriptional regulator [Oscillospiraceae bacterium]